MSSFSILITTKNRINELKYTLGKIEHLIQLKNVDCIICDDGSADDTFEYVETNYSNIEIIKNTTSKGLIFSRNRLLNLTTSKYAISLDDDAHFLTTDVLELIESHFNNYSKSALASFRVYWGENEPVHTNSNEKTLRVKGFVGCGHVWNMKAWNEISNYPDWFVFYGEEEFASFQLFKNGWEVHYLPSVLVHHRVDVRSRKKDKDYRLRLRRSLRSGWYLYFLFYPWKLIPKKLTYTLWMQFKLKVIKGDFKAFMAILQAMGDVLINIPRLMKNSNRLSSEEYKRYLQLPDTKLYWKPEKL